ncbi:MAG: hypothetical protein M4579_000241 [Chaenotheca gracillima]|nr:MAG: hypothetical protein M4579_000241 [Chaenotheca gracillima]
MATSIYPAYPPRLTPEQSDYLISNLKDWSIAHGLTVRPPATFVSPDVDPQGVLAGTAPVTLFPSPFPKACFEEAKSIQTAYNQLYASIANDEEWLKEIVEEIVEVDDFIAQLWNTHLAVKKEGYSEQDLSLGMFRSDYMVHVDPSASEPNPELRQVEFNTIASSFGGLAARVSELHKYLHSISAYTADPLISSSALPNNKSIASLTEGLAASHELYGPSKSEPSLTRCVVIIVQDPERNVFDQRHIEYTLQTTHKIPIFRVPFEKVLTHLRVAPTEKRPLIYEPAHLKGTQFEVTTVYFRAGYAPSEYDSPAAWSARLQIERSAAIKCPSVLTHLAGSKKIQQVLATPSSSHLSRFLSLPACFRGPSDETRIRATFASIYPLDDTSEAGRHARELALNPTTAQGYVLKPQREGGGNNVYRGAIPEFLQSIPEAHWKGYVLMEIIEPPALENSIFRNGELATGGVIGELGVYGVCIWKDSKRDESVSASTSTAEAPGTSGNERPESAASTKPEILRNWEAGYLLRTKGSESEEGGVAAGFGSVDSCLLIDV